MICDSYDIVVIHWYWYRHCTYMLHWGVGNWQVGRSSKGFLAAFVFGSWFFPCQTHSHDLVTSGSEVVLIFCIRRKKFSFTQKTKLLPARKHGMLITNLYSECQVSDSNTYAIIFDICSPWNWFQGLFPVWYFQEEKNLAIPHFAVQAACLPFWRSDVARVLTAWMSLIVAWLLQPLIHTANLPRQTVQQGLRIQTRFFQCWSRNQLKPSQRVGRKPWSVLRKMQPTPDALWAWPPCAAERMVLCQPWRRKTCLGKPAWTSCSDGR